MVATCPVCREVVHVHMGYFVRHGARHHGLLNVCAGSGAPICSFVDSCCG